MCVRVLYGLFTLHSVTTTAATSTMAALKYHNVLLLPFWALFLNVRVVGGGGLVTVAVAVAVFCVPHRKCSLQLLKSCWLVAHAVAHCYACCYDSFLLFIVTSN